MIGKFIRTLFLGVVLLALLAVAVIGGSWWVISHAANGRVINNASALPKEDVALVLGTSPQVAGQFANPHFDNRMAAAAKLFHEGRVHRLLLSGDNRQKDYDEPTAMRRALLALGVPASAMTLDYAGFRTLDSVARAGKVFGLHKMVIVSDGFHVTRALFLARKYGIDAVAFPSRDVDLRYSMKSQVREWFARVKACLDIYVLHTKPHFLGKPEAAARPVKDS